MDSGPAGIGLGVDEGGVRFGRARSRLVLVRQAGQTIAQGEELLGRQTFEALGLLRPHWGNLVAHGAECTDRAANEQQNRRCP